MTPEHIAALSEHLRSQGVEFRPVELETFAVGVPPQVDGDPDIEALTARFVEVNRVYATQARKRKRANRTLRDGSLLLAAGAGCLAISATAYEVSLVLALPPSGTLALVLSLFVCLWILAVIFAVVGCAFVLPGLSSLAWSHLRWWLRFGKWPSGDDRRED